METKEMRTISEITKELAQEHRKYSTLTTKRNTLSKHVSELKRELVELMEEEEMQQIKNVSGTFYFTNRKKPKVMDYEAFSDYIYKNKRLDLLYMHLNKEAEYLTEQLMERTNRGIPGVEILPFKILNVKGAKDD